MDLDSYVFPKTPAEVEVEEMRLHVVEVSPSDYVELVIDDRRYLIAKAESPFKTGDLIHLKPIDLSKTKPSLFERLKRFFNGDNYAFKIYSVSNLFVVTCRDVIPDCKYIVIGLRSLRQ